MDIKLMADVYRIGISIGLFSIQEVIKWTDNIIDQLDTPPYELIDLSLSAKEKLENITLKLMKVKGEVDNELPPKIILGLLNNNLNDMQDMQNVIETMDKLIKYLPASCEWMEMEIHFLSDGFYLAEENVYGELGEVLNNLKIFLNQFNYCTEYFT